MNTGLRRGRISALTSGWLWGLFRIRFINSLQYRAEAWSGFATQFGFGLMNVLMFSVFYGTNPAAFPMTFQQTVSHLWMQQGLMALVSVGYGDRDVSEISSAIETGAVAYELVRPVNLFNRWAFQIAANRCAGTLLRLIPLMAVAFMLPSPFGLTLPAGGLNAVLFIFSSVLSLGVVIGINMLIYISAFYTTSQSGIRGIIAASTEFLSGALIPIPFFPEPFRSLVELLPFGSLQNTPLRIYTGSFSGQETARGIAVQIFWVAALWALGKLAMGRALRKVVVQGG